MKSIKLNLFCSTALFLTFSNSKNLIAGPLPIGSISSYSSGSQLSRAPGSNDDSQHGCVVPSSTALGSLWLFNRVVYQPTSCSIGSAKWVQVVPTGLACDLAIASGSTAVCYGTMLLTATYTGHLFTLASQTNPSITQPIDALGTNLGNYALADTFVSGNPYAYAVTWNDQSTSQTDNASSMQSLAGPTVSASTGTYGVNATITLTTTGCTDSTPTPGLFQINGTGPLTGSYTQYPICKTGDMSTTQTQASCATNGSTCGTAMTITNVSYNSGFIWNTDKKLGQVRPLTAASISIPRGSQNANALAMTVPSFSFNPGNSTTIMIGSIDNDGGTYQLDAAKPDGSGVNILTGWSPYNNITFTVSNAGSAGGCQVAPMSNAFIFEYNWTFSLNGGGTCWENNNQGFGTVSAQTAVIGLQIGSMTGGGQAFKGEFGAYIKTSPALSISTINSINVSLVAESQIAPQNNIVVRTGGDSGCQSTGSVYGHTIQRWSQTGTAYQIIPYTPMLNVPVRMYNNCQSGTTTAQAITAQSYSYTNIYSPYLYEFIDVLVSFPNDIRNSNGAGAQTSAIEANIQQYVNNVHALGSNAKSIIGIYPLQNDIFTNLTYSNEYSRWLAVATWIRTMWNVPQAQGGAGADGLLDYTQGQSLGPVNWTTAPFSGCVGNTGIILSPDCFHPTDLAMGYMARVFADSVNALLPLQ